MTIKELKTICDAFTKDGGGDKDAFVFCKDNATMYDIENIGNNNGHLQLDTDMDLHKIHFSLYNSDYYTLMYVCNYVMEEELMSDETLERLREVVDILEVAKGTFANNRIIDRRLDNNMEG